MQGPRDRFFFLFFLISGFCGLLYEVVWTRMFTLVIGNTVFSVSSILTVFMAGLALGSRLGGRFGNRLAARVIARPGALIEREAMADLV